MRPSTPSEPAPAATSLDAGHGPAFWIGLTLGGGLMAYGVRGVLTDLGPGKPLELVTWVVALDLVHDLLVAPIVVVVGLLLARALPLPARGPVGAAAGLSAIVLAFSIPLLTGWGRRAGNSSTLPLDYARNVAIVLAVVWAVAAVTATVRMARR